MVRKLIALSLNNKLVVILLALALATYGMYAFLNVNVEAYPDPAPAIVEVIAQFPGASAEEVERQVTVPLEVTFAGMPYQTHLRSKSLFGLSHLRLQFEYGYPYESARQETINRLQFTQPLPPGVTPQISPQSPTGEIYRYTLRSPLDGAGKPIYTLNDLKALQDWVLEREFRRVPRIVDVSSSGGMVKRYEIHPDANRLRRYGITLAQVQAAISNANANVGGDYVIQGHVALNVRSFGLFSGGLDPAQQVLGMDKVAVDAYRDACLAEAIGVIKKEQRQRTWQQLAEGRLTQASRGREPPVEGAKPGALAPGSPVTIALYRLQRGADEQSVLPPLSKEEKEQVANLRRLREAVARREPAGLLPRLREKVRGKKDPYSLSADERSLVEEARRIAAGFASREVKPPLSEEETEEVDTIRRWVATRAAARLRDEENRRIIEIRKLVITSVNNVPILIEDVVMGGRLKPGDKVGERGVVVSHQTRLGRVGLTKPYALPPGYAPIYAVNGTFDLNSPFNGQQWRNEDDKVQCIVLLRKGEESIPALEGVRKKVSDLNDPASGRMLPGVKIETYYDRTELIGITTETVRENLFLGMALVTVILLMFLSNVRSALIVAINIPLALLFAFSVLFLRGKSANLLSIGAVDFGIIVDSSVIMVENIYRHISSGENSHLPLKERILLACHEVEGPLFFSTLIMVCAFIPLFTMRGPEGQIFGPMADTYAFALGGALLLALVVAPVLCLIFFRNLKPVEDNFLVRYLKRRFLTMLGRVLTYRWISLGVFTSIILVTILYPLPRLGREFMPELEEGNLWIRGTFPLNVSLERVTSNAAHARAILSKYPEVEAVVLQIGRPDDGTDPTGFYNVEIFVPLKPRKHWPLVMKETSLWRFVPYWGGPQRARYKEEMIKQMNEELSGDLPGVDWNFSQNIRDNVMESLSGIKGDNSVKIFGPDLEELEKMAVKVRDVLRSVQGIENVGVFNIKGQTNLEFRIDLDKCKRWGVSAADVNNVVQTALGAKPLSTMIEGEKMFDIAVRWQKDQRSSEMSILDIPVDVSNNTVTPPPSGTTPTPSPTGSSVAPPSRLGSQTDTSNPISSTPRLRLRDLVSPVGKDGSPDRAGSFERAGASTIYREGGNRMIAVKFSVRGRDLAGAVAEAQEKARELVKPPYRLVWSGEFEEMEKAEARLMIIIPASLALIFMLLYMAFRSWLDAFLVLANVLDLSVGGIWALYLTGTHFSISAAVGFVSIFGVAVMDGLLLVAYFNHMRSQGLPLREAIMEGASKRIRPVMMTALTAIFGLLPAAFSTRIGAQTQRPLAIVVVGGMVTTLFLTRYLMPLLYSFYGHRTPPAGGGLAH
jgi:cobalt-zinc-cadmium resistance protein CzcA